MPLYHDALIMSSFAPGAGFEPATNRLTVDRSTAELSRNMFVSHVPLRAWRYCSGKEGRVLGWGGLHLEDTMRSNQKAYSEAVGRVRSVEELLHALSVGRDDEDTATVLGQEIRSMVPIGLWEHWKSQNEPGMSENNDHWKFYVVKGLKVDDDGLPTIVDYSALYAPNAGDPYKRSLVDPEEGFLVPMDRPQWKPRPYTGPRFRLIRRLTPEQCELLIAQALHIAVYTTRYAALSRIRRTLD